MSGSFGRRLFVLGLGRRLGGRLALRRGLLALPELLVTLGLLGAVTLGALQIVVRPTWHGSSPVGTRKIPGTTMGATADFLKTARSGRRRCGVARQGLLELGRVDRDGLRAPRRPRRQRRADGGRGPAIGDDRDRVEALLVGFDLVGAGRLLADDAAEP